MPVRIFVLFLLFFLVPGLVHSQPGGPVHTGNSFVSINPHETPDQIVEKAAHVTPSMRQLDWQRLEFNAFLHFGMNTFTGREWGDGNDDPALFNPISFDARQWARVIRDAGMKMAIITAKHHDGFCLWPSKFTKYSVASSGWKKGNGDVVAEVARACRESGLKFGVYLSPWDRHEPCYGDSAAYNTFFMNQLRELLTNYGEVSEVWFDGACGEGPNGKRQVYNWKAWYALIRELQPGAVIAIMGPDVRWVGTESGYGRATEWSVVPDVTLNLDSVAASSQQFPVDRGFIPGDRTATDLGSREKLKDAKSLAWYPSENDVSIRPGWFYHKSEDKEVKGPEKLVDIYLHSVGMNAVLLLNIPPDRRGLIHKNDIRSLKGMRKILIKTFRNNLLIGAAVSTVDGKNQGRASVGTVTGIIPSSDSVSTADRNNPNGGSARPVGRNHPTGVSVGIVDVNAPGGASVKPVVASPSAGAPVHQSNGLFEYSSDHQITFNLAMIREDITIGQRIEKFHLDFWNGSEWNTFAEGTSVGYKRILRFPEVQAQKIRLVIEETRGEAALMEVGLYKMP